MYSTQSSWLIADPAVVREWDELTVKTQQISSFALMQRASDAFVDELYQQRLLWRHKSSTIAVLCGPGNNGGDGACIARTLAQQRHRLQVWSYPSSGGQRSADGATAWQQLEEEQQQQSGGFGDNLVLHIDKPYQHSGEDDLLIIDALFGIGLDRALTGAFAKTVATVNAAKATVVSVDTPSGQQCRGLPENWPCVEAKHTFTFAALKRAALLPRSGAKWGEVHVLNINLVNPAEHPQLARQFEQEPTVLTDRYVAEQLLPRRRFTHKGTYGHVLVMAGSRGHAGAALLAGQGAYRAGAGLVTFYVPQRLEPLMQGGLPEAMCLVDPAENHLTTCPDFSAYDAIVFGPGIGQHATTKLLLQEVLLACSSEDKAVVLDADALNLLAAKPELLAKLPPKTILTPHPGEFTRLLDGRFNELDQLEAAAAFAKTHLAPLSCVVLKDQCTLNQTGDRRSSVNYFYGNPGMASGGMGDTLSGVIGAHLAGGLPPYEAALTAVALHAKAGDLAADNLGRPALLATDVANQLGNAYKFFSEH